MPSSADRERGAREIRRDYREDSYQNRRREVRTRLFDPGRAGIVLAAGAGTVRLFGGSTRGTRRGVSSILTRTFRLGVAVTGRECIVWRGRRLNQGPASMTTRLTAQPRPETAAAKRNRYRQEEANEDPEWAATVEHESAAVYTPGGRTLCGGFGGPRRGSPPARVGDVAPFVPPRPTVACKPTTSPQNLVDLQRTGSIRLWIRSLTPARESGPVVVLEGESLSESSRARPPGLGDWRGFLGQRFAGLVPGSGIGVDSEHHTVLVEHTAKTLEGSGSRHQSVCASQRERVSASLIGVPAVIQPGPGPCSVTCQNVSEFRLGRW
jgi:hypothetical protein